MKKILLLASLLALTAQAGGLDQNIRTQAGVKFIGSISASDAVGKALLERGMANVQDKRGMVDVLLSATDAEQCAARLRGMGLKVGTANGGGVTARVPVDMLGKLASTPGVSAINMARPLFPLLDDARAAGSVDMAHAGTGLTTPFNGENTIVGIIDSGFQYDHGAFVDPDTKQSRISCIWEQQCDTLESLHPDKFAYGCEYAPGKATLARSYDIVTSTHGTHVAGIAAGGDTRYGNKYYGVAPKSEIVLVSTKSTDASVIDAVKYIFDYADSQHKPCVINISLGSNIGPHDGTGYADRMLDAMQGEGRLIVGAVGNSSGDKCHARKSFSVRDHSLNTGLQFTYYGKTQLGLVDIWGTQSKKFKTTIYVYDKAANKRLATFETIDATQSGTKTFNFKGLESIGTDSIEVNVVAQSGVDPNNGKPNVYVTAVCSNINKKNVFLGIETEAVSGTVDMWNDGVYSTFNNLGNPAYTSGDSECSVSELGGTGKKIISVGAFASKNKYTLLNGNSRGTSYAIGSICAFSSAGPTVDGRVKPEIAAPGSILVSAYNRYYGAFDPSKMVSALSVDGKASYYGTMQGTSMASPFVAGVMALWLQADPSLSPEKAKQILQASAANDSFTGNVRQSGSPQWGYGKVDAYKGLQMCLESGVDMVASNGVQCSCSVTDGTLQVLLSGDSNDVEVSVYSPSGRLVGRNAVHELNALTPLCVSGIPSGVAIVKVGTSSSSHTLKVVAR